MLLHQSNRLEHLFAQLSAILGEPPDDPLTPEIIVVHNQGMAQWISRRLALTTGIAANLFFPLPGRCVWELLDRLTGEQSGDDLFQPSILRWRIAALLPELLAHPAFAEPAAYLASDHDGTRLYQLAGQMGDVLDQYQVYRPDLLVAWQEGEEAHWQAVLWQRLTATGAAQRVGLGERLRHLLLAPEIKKERLPQRLHLFGLNSLAPVYLEIFEQLSRLIPLHLYHLSPCLHYWGDLVSARHQAAMRGKGRQAGPESYHEQGHPLLVSLGRTGQDFFRQLQACAVEDEIDLYQPAEEQHLLAMVQNDILELRDRSADGEDRIRLGPHDRSIQFHCCHSPLREIQVLYDRLLDLFTILPELSPGDILVSAPDISRYADAIAGVFGEVSPERRIPWSIADQALAGEQPQIRCFLDLLGLLDSRFTAPEVLALCENPLLLARFGLDASLLPRVHVWAEEAGIRWGLDSDHRRELEAGIGGQHSWRFGLDRLVLGYLMGDCAQTWAGFLPLGHPGSGEDEALGGFAELADTLADWHHQVRADRQVEQWCLDLLRMITDFFGTETDDPGVELLQQTILRLQADSRLAGLTAPLSFAVLKTHLLETLSQPGGGQPFLSGRVTFCNMVPMRSVPFRVICLLGLGDQDFPRSQYPPSFDLMAAAPRLGDRNRRNDDRYLFLEALLSAREVLYLSWVGRSQRDESLVPPSVVVCELRDFLDQSCCPESGERLVSEVLTTEHPMQPFSRRCFDGTAAVAGYNPAWLPASEVSDRPPFLNGPLPETEEDTRCEIDLTQLVRFWRHPVRFFLEQGLGLTMDRGETVLEENEPFQLHPLQRYALRRQSVLESLAGMSDEQTRCNLEGSGLLPQAGFGRVQLQAIQTEAKAISRQLHPLLADPLEPMEIDCCIGPFHLTGWLGQLFPQGRITWRPGRLKGADLMEWWLAHLCLQLLHPSGVARTSLHCSWERQQRTEQVQRNRLRPVDDPEPILARLLTLHCRGLHYPLPFFPETSLAWAQAAQEKPGQEADRARPVWTGGFQRDGEGKDPAYPLLFPSDTLPISEEFVALTELFIPILAHLEDDHATA